MPFGGDTCFKTVLYLNEFLILLVIVLLAIGYSDDEAFVYIFTGLVLFVLVLVLTVALHRCSLCLSPIEDNLVLAV